MMERSGIGILARSRWWRSAPWPPGSVQPPYVNGVVVVESALEPRDLLATLHRIETELGRVRGARNAPRPVDLDLIDYHGRVSVPGETPELPHPRMAQRDFVLLPLQEVAPGWRHPADGRPLESLIAAIDPGEHAQPFDFQEKT
jgi:2-amino-4-hydroxy-6-hydroxymethyldihydropteridine diphosphokinase